MGIRFRRSINLGGGFRVNISRSGIGYSWGTRGYRYTRTASGRTRRTFSIPGTGISYVSESGPRSRTGNSNNSNASAAQPEYEGLEHIGDADLDRLRSEAFNDLFKQIRKKRMLNILFIIGFFAFFASLPPLSAVFAVGFIYIHTKGRCWIEYDFDEEKKAEWDRLSSAWREVAGSDVLKQIVATAKPKNQRTVFGADSLVNFIKITAGDKLPHYIRTNVKPVVFRLRNCKMAILPDRLFLFGKHGKYGAVDYRDVYYEFSAIGYIETEKAPRDSEFVRKAWRYANRDGSPDRRYKQNKEFPVYKYGQIEIKSMTGGIDIKLLCSNEMAAETLAKTIGNRAHIK